MYSRSGAGATEQTKVRTKSGGYQAFIALTVVGFALLGIVANSLEASPLSVVVGANQISAEPAEPAPASAPPVTATAPKQPSSSPSVHRPAEAVASPVVVPGSHDRMHSALLIGVNRPKGSPPVEGSVTDAENIRKALLSYGWAPEDITVLAEGAATRPRILSELRRLAERTSPDGLAVVSVSTHSAWIRGETSFATVTGERIGAHEFARHMAAVRARTWTIMATCYAGGYALPGVVGPGRIGTFSSDGQTKSYQLGSAGSVLVMTMVKDGMLERRQPTVESAFAYAAKKISEEYGQYEPVISDGVQGDLAPGTIR